MRRAARVRVALLCLAIAAGCDRRTAEWVAPADEPPKLERPLRIPGLEAPKPQADAPRDMPALAATGAPIRGSVALAPGASASPGGVLFVIARRDAAAAGPPLAVKRLAATRFPIEFEIGPGDVMIPGQPWSRPLFLSARLDADGNAMTRDPADPDATLSAPLEPGAANVQLVLGAPAAASPTPPAAAPAASAAGVEPIRGVIRLRDGVAAPPDSVLFLVARSTAGGPPLAAKRLPPGPFPLAFELGSGDTMLAGRPLHGPLLLSARLDADGDASSKSPDEPHAELSEPVLPGAQGVELVLSR
jgi:hypothetical protein